MPKLRTRVIHALFLMVERVLTWCVNPYWRATLLRLLGARIGKNVRIYEARFFNLMTGFQNLKVEDNVHIGTGCLIDLSDEVVIRKNAVLSPRVVVLTHSDPGEYHHSELSKMFPRRTAPVVIGGSSWIGANSVILCGAEIGSLTVLGANSLVNERIPPKVMAGGSPARKLRDLDIDLEASAGESESPSAGAGVSEELDD